MLQVCFGVLAGTWACWCATASLGLSAAQSQSKELLREDCEAHIGLPRQTYAFAGLDQLCRITLPTHFMQCSRSNEHSLHLRTPAAVVPNLGEARLAARPSTLSAT